MDKRASRPLKAAAQAQPNIALIKYWGKRDIALNLPAAGSLSITLESLWTRTGVAFDPTLDRDRLNLNGAEDAAQAGRASACLDLLRARAGVDWRARIDSHNNFPTGAGLASSASGFAALVRAAAAALEVDLDARELSILARRGSGSAARSIFGGFVEMAAGTRADGEDAFAQPVLGATEWPLQVVVAVTSKRAKSIGSTAGMELSRRTSPFYADYVATTPGDLAAARRAVLGRNFEALAALSEHSCLKMHGMMLATQPGLLYWSGATVECLHRVRALREQEGLGVFFTVDAGPQVKAICLPDYAARVAAALADVPGVEEVMTTGLGEGARVIEGASELSCVS
ncbi:MAG TPA: diphosphomevalonate decarboxylase [Gammaproteobacteria bacterium]|nr:diphosphomevalonate decarboxylase [Gammaproteobacteria bacterium]